MEEQFVDKFIAEVLVGIKCKRLALPTLPEVAIKIGETVDDPDATAAQLAKVISIDAALSARLLQAANSPLFRSIDPIDSIKAAITRLGAAQVKTLINSIVVEQIFQFDSNTKTKAILQKQWLHSMKVAAISYILAQRFTNLKPDIAMLAGLIHDIGTLPILSCANKYPELLEDEALLTSVIHPLHTQIGRLVLQSWNFPPELVAVASEHENYNRISDPAPDYVDIIMIANIHTHIGKHHTSNEIDWTSIPAFKALGLTPEESLAALEEARSEVQTVLDMLKV